MDEFKPEDELKPDASDRRPTRSRKSSSAPKAPVSRQHMMMGVGILVLLLLVLGIGSALKGPEDKTSTSATSSANNATGSASSGKNIDLSESSSMTGGQQAGSTSGENAAPVADNAAGNSGRDVSMPPISSTPTQAQPVEAPANQQRVTVPGDLSTALNNQQGEVNSAARGQQAGNALPTAPATVSNPGGNGSSPASDNRNTQQSAKAPPTRQQPERQAAQPARAETKGSPAKSTAPARADSSATRSTESAKATAAGGNYTLQLSSASRPDTLNAWAKQQNLSGYHVYKTTRNGQPWYVLVSGSYATPAEAKRAVATLPAAVQAQKPWVKPVSQVNKATGH